MKAFSPINSYVLGAASVGLGLHAILRPREETTRCFGLPLETPPRPTSTTTAIITERRKTTTTGAGGMAIYLKGIRDVSYGVALIALQYQGNSAGVTTVAGVMALVMGLGDGMVVWLCGLSGRGGEEEEGSTSRNNTNRAAWGHWGAAVGVGVGVGSWAAWRAFVAYGEWAGFHALNY